MEKERANKSRRGVTPITAALLALVCLVVAAAWGAKRSSRPRAESQVVRSHSRPANASTTRGRAIATQPPSASAWSYDAVVRRNLFRPLGPRQPEPPNALPPLKPMPIDAFQLRQIGHGDEEAGAAAPEQPTWIYAGYATVNGNAVAIVENSATKQAQFLTAGETFDGATVSGISAQAVKLTRGSETKEMPISEAFTATPLNEPPKPAAEPARGRGSSGRGGFANGPGGGGFLGRILPVLRDNPELADQARRFIENFAPPGSPPGGGWPPLTDVGQPEGGQP
jgi:hypothetical protein